MRTTVKNQHQNVSVQCQKKNITDCRDPLFSFVSDAGNDGCGLKNLGNSCFINAFVQCFANEDILVTRLLDYTQAHVKDGRTMAQFTTRILIAHKNKSPLIDKETRRFIASAVIDRYLYDQQHQEKYDDDLNEKLEELFKELQEKRLPIDLTNEPDECVSDIDMLE
eukprot:646866_1